MAEIGVQPLPSLCLFLVHPPCFLGLVVLLFSPQPGQGGAVLLVLTCPELHPNHCRAIAELR